MRNLQIFYLCIGFLPGFSPVYGVPPAPRGGFAAVPWLLAGGSLLLGLGYGVRDGVLWLSAFLV